MAELTELSRIETGKTELRLEPADLNALAGEVVRQLQPQAERKRLSLSVSLSPDISSVNADRERIRQVMTNLVHNTVKFTSGAGIIDRRVSASPECEPELNMARIVDVDNIGYDG